MSSIFTWTDLYQELADKIADVEVYINTWFSFDQTYALEKSKKG